MTALDSIEAGRWSRAHLVDGFDSRGKLPDPADPEQVEAARERREVQRKIAQAEGRRQELEDALIDAATRAELDRASAELADIEARIKALPAPEMVYAVVPHAPRPIHLLNRGDVEQPGELVAPGALSCVPGLDPDFPPSDSDDEGSRRAALADWIADPRNVLTWRSIVNRVWHYHFGRGIVDTPNDFGRNGSAADAPRAARLAGRRASATNGQSLKRLHR